MNKVNRKIDVATAAIDPAGRLAEPIACCNCGYNLFSLDTAGMCPECGAAVKRSLWVRRLRQCDPTWLRVLGRDSKWMAFGMLGIVVLQGVALFASATISKTIPMSPTNIRAYLAVSTTGLLGVTVVSFFIGSWKLTRREPQHPERLLSIRRLSRIALIAALLIGVVLMAVGGHRSVEFDERSLAMMSFVGFLGLEGALTNLGLVAGRIRMRYLNALIWLTVSLPVLDTVCWGLWYQQTEDVPILPDTFNHSITVVAGLLLALLPLWLFITFNWIGQRLRDAAMPTE